MQGWCWQCLRLPLVGLDDALMCVLVYHSSRLAQEAIFRICWHMECAQATLNTAPPLPVMSGLPYNE